jgi:hypothetical protein
VVILGTIQYSVHPPTLYVAAHVNQLLPAWSMPIRSVLIVLQQSKQCLLVRTEATERDKDLMRQRFLDMSTPVALNLIAAGYMAEVFDPRTGLPTLSTAGSIGLDDVAIAQTALGYPVTNYETCPALIHPIWGNAVYPSTLLSSAPIHVLADIADRVIGLDYCTPVETGSA